MNFGSSSQLARWTLTKSQLDESRQTARNSALESTASAEEPLSVEDEKALLGYYEKSITAFCQQQNYPLHVQATALIYLKRFYVHHSVLSYDPSRLFITCVYVASKVEEEYLPLDSLVSSLPNLTESMLRKTELRLLKALGYDLIVHTPFKDIDGLIEDLSVHMRNGELEKTGLERFEELAAVKKSAYAAAQCLLETDAPLIFKPSKLALAAVRSGFKTRKRRLDAYLDQVISPMLREKGGLTLDDVQQELSEIDSLGVKGSKNAVQTEHVQSIDRKLKAWLKQQTKAKASKEQDTASQNQV